MSSARGALLWGCRLALCAAFLEKSGRRCDIFLIAEYGSYNAKSQLPPKPILRKLQPKLSGPFETISAVFKPQTASETTMAVTGTSPEEVTAALLVIGDEILSGRTKDKNIGFIAAHCTQIGIRLKGSAGRCR